MTELHIVVQMDDDYVKLFAAAVENLTEIPHFGVEHWGIHVHEDAAPSGEIVGWTVVQRPQQRDFEHHADAERHARRTGGDLFPIFAGEGAHA